MLLHLSETKTLQRFLRVRKQQKEPAKQAVSDNIVAFPTPTIQPSTDGKEQVFLDWKERIITKKQIWYIQLLLEQQELSIETLNKQCFTLYGTDLSRIKRVEASEVIQSLKRSLSQQYKPFH